jgi:hypothetical protein
MYIGPVQNWWQEPLVLGSESQEVNFSNLPSLSTLLFLFLLLGSLRLFITSLLDLCCISSKLCSLLLVSLVTERRRFLQSQLKETLHSTVII